LYNKQLVTSYKRAEVTSCLFPG